MMKRITAVLIATLAITTCTACGGQKEKNDRSTKYVFDEKVAEKTIEKIVDLDLNVVEATDTLPDNFEGIPTDDGKYTIWNSNLEVSYMQQMVFLFNDDKNAVIATPVDVELKYPQIPFDEYKTNINTKKGVFAWEYDSHATAISPSDINITSIWMLEKNKISLVWKDSK